MQWSADRHGGFSMTEDAKALQRPVTEGPFGPAHVNVAAQRRDPDSLLNWFERLIRRRRECPEIGFGKLTVLETGAPSVLAHRCDWEDSTVVAVHELGGEAVEVSLPIDDGDALVDLFDDDVHELPAKLRLAPHAAHWFRIRREDARLPP
jgi:maltose alpha-D-glucosyltransferase/alpha-amylase